jgi:hypothetical protein
MTKPSVLLNLELGYRMRVKPMLTSRADISMLATEDRATGSENKLTNITANIGRLENFPIADMDKIVPAKDAKMYTAFFTATWWLF